ncbi:hypothetical protein BpHYR1_018057 [Brachionus plicatilis]|uniref:Uncharacterized protein n=1 Tax=Brachionus plicatilis TaxID=10195 RepID=A0A3M7S3R7_BRAPC|nr:hypothetical protein BpHYR1_018057 [Brachionus plicatilis]
MKIGIKNDKANKVIFIISLMLLSFIVLKKIISADLFNGRIESEPIPLEPKPKFLGIKLDRKLKFAGHFKEIK